MVRVGSRSSDPDVLVSAYEGAAGQKMLIAMNRSTAPRWVAVEWPGAGFTRAECVDPYRANQGDADLLGTLPHSLKLAPGSIVTLTNVPVGTLPSDFSSANL